MLGKVVDVAPTLSVSIAGSAIEGQTLTATPVQSSDEVETVHYQWQSSADGGTNFPIQTSPAVAVSSGALVQGTPYCVSFNNSANAWVLFATYANALNVPLGTVLDYTGASAPNSSFASLSHSASAANGIGSQSRLKYSCAR